MWSLLSCCFLLVLSNNPESGPRPVLNSASKPICGKKTVRKKMFFRPPKWPPSLAIFPSHLKFFPPTRASSFCPMMGVEKVRQLAASTPPSQLAAHCGSQCLERSKGSGSDTKWQAALGAEGLLLPKPYSGAQRFFFFFRMAFWELLKDSDRIRGC